MKPALDILDVRDAAAPFAFTGFDSLIAPLGRAAFDADYHEQAPLFIKRARPGYFGALFSMDDVDHLIGSRLLRNGDIRLAKDGAVTPYSAISVDGTAGGAADRNAIIQAYAGGATVVFEHVNRHHPVLGRVLAQCEVELEFPVRANSYLTPARSNGFSLHYDTHDVLVLQVSGSKTWQIWDNPLPLPHEEQPFSPTMLARARQLAEVTLEPGDVLYLPRGFIHGANANDAPSLHLTLGMRSMTLRDVALSALKHAAMATPRLRQVARFRGPQREAVLAQSRQWLHEALDEVDIGALFDDVLYSFIRKRTRPMDGRLLALHAPPVVNHDTLLRVRPDCLMHVFEKRDQVALVVDGRTIMFPQGVQDALGYMRSHAPFAPSELPGMERNSQLILTQRLCAEDVLEPAYQEASQLQQEDA